MDNLKEFFCYNLQNLNIDYDDEMVVKSLKYMENILEWNEKINLTAIKEPKEFIVKHFIDSLLIFNMEEYKSAKKNIDIGTGAGFPGIPLAVFSPEKTFYLVDSLNKRLKVIKEIADELEINNVEVIHSRAEDLRKNLNIEEGADLVLSRAVANMKKLSHYMIPYVKKNGWALALKGPTAEEELSEAKEDIISLGGDDIRIVSIPSNGLNHKVIAIHKK